MKLLTESLNEPSFRAYLPDSASMIGREKDDAFSHTEKVFAALPAISQIKEMWNQQWSEPFKGITTNGTVVEGLYQVNDDGIDTSAIVDAANSVLASLSSEQRKRVLHPLHAPERRAWANPELYIWRHGIRLEHMDESVRCAVFALMQSTLSPSGYEKAVAAMKINHFLGKLVNAPGVLNMHSYNFLLFGNVSLTEPFGWLLYGHHLCLSVLVWKTQITITPTFTGAEPNFVDEEPYKGLRILRPEQDLGLAFMQGLPQDMKSFAQIFKTMQPPEIPDHRYNPADQRHLCGAFQDNRIVPYEGLNVSSLDEGLLDILFRLIEEFILYLPSKARQNRLALIRHHINETYFSWIGGYGHIDPFYYKIHSPVIICEFDHHSGVFLENKEPQRFHIHTIVRTPNGGDYGYALLDSSP